MTRLKRIVLDVLKPHAPSVLEFSRALAEQDALAVRSTVLEMDEKTETLKVVIEGPDIDFERVQTAIAEAGAALHSIDEVDVDGEPDTSV